MTDPQEPRKPTGPQQQSQPSRQKQSISRRADKSSLGSEGCGEAAGNRPGAKPAEGGPSGSKAPPAAEKPPTQQKPGSTSAGKLGGGKSLSSGQHREGTSSGSGAAARSSGAEKGGSSRSSSNEQIVPLDELPPLIDSNDPLSGLSTLGGLESLLDEPALSGGQTSPLSATGPLAAGPLSPVSASRPPLEIPRWLIGAGAAIGAIALVVVIVVVMVMNRSDGSDELAEADQAYESGRWAEAIDKYETFLTRFPSHPQTERVHLRRGLAVIQRAGAERQWGPAAERATELLPQLAAMPGFSEAASRLTGTLGAVAAGLAEAAEQGDAAAARNGLVLIEAVAQTMPQIDFTSQRLDRAEDTFGRRQYEARREERRRESLASIEKARDKPDEVLRLRRALIAHYPELRDDEQLRNVVSGAMAQHRPEWKEFSQPIAPIEDPPQPVTLTPFRREVTAAEPAQGLPPVLPVVFGGRLYAIGSDGRLLWQRSIGVAASGRSVEPIARLDHPDQADWIVLQRRRPNAVLRCEASSGKLRWCAPLEADAIGRPVIIDQTAYVCLRNRTIRQIDIESGTARGQWQLPQPAAAGLAVDAESSSLFVPGEELDLYRISLRDGRAEMIHLGHEWGEVRFAPIIAGHAVIVVVQRALARSSLVVLSRDCATASLRRVAEIPLEGTVVGEPQSDGRYLAVGTDAGRLYVFRCKKDASQPLESGGDLFDGRAGRPEGDRPVGARPPMLGHPIFPAIVGETILVGGERLRAVAFDDRGRIKADAAVEAVPAGWLVGPPWCGGTSVFFAQRHPLGGLSVAALDWAGKKLLWRTLLATPAAGAAALGSSPGTVQWLLADGTLFETPIDAPAGVIDTPRAQPREFTVRGPLRHVCRLPDGALTALTSGGDELLVYLPTEAAPKSANVPGRAAARPIVFGSYLFLVNRNGQALLIDPVRGTVAAMLPLPDWAITSDDTLPVGGLHVERVGDDRCRVRSRDGNRVVVLVRTDPVPQLEKIADDKQPPAKPVEDQRPTEWDELGVPFVGPPADLGDLWAMVGSQGTLYLIKKKP